MRLASTVVLLTLSVAGVHAATIDVTGDSTVTLGTGDRLLIYFGIWNFSAYPTQIDLSVATALLPYGGALLQAGIESLDGAVAVSAGAPLALAPGSWSSAGSSGDVGAATFQFQMTAPEAAALFGPGALDRYTEAAVAVIVNEGSAFTLGLSAASFRQGLSVSLSDGTRGTGAWPGAVYLDSASGGPAFAGGTVPDDPAPEPATLLLCGASLAALEIGRRRRRFLL
jgi:hypothetical protein